MKISHALFAVVDLLLLALTAGIGFQVEGTTGYTRHVLLGVLAALFTCFVHVVLFMYFVVQEKIVAQAILHHGLAGEFGGPVRRLKSRALRWSMSGIGMILVTSALGSGLDSAFSVRIHLAAAFAAIFVEGVAFYFQFLLLDEYRRLFREAFGE
ncbi:MAG TPA: hypothetical protein VNT79_18560 [Phycisphaerae bacterium]|nr:hypothetical protein [Phycisphaerae bacterium]